MNGEHYYSDGILTVTYLSSLNSWQTPNKSASSFCNVLASQACKQNKKPTQRNEKS